MKKKSTLISDGGVTEKLDVLGISVTTISIILIFVLCFLGTMAFMG